MEEPKRKKKAAAGRRFVQRGASGEPGLQGEQMDKWQSNLNSLQKPSMEKAHLHGQLRGQDCAMEQAGTPVYNSKYQQQIDALLDQVAGRGSFNYDVGSDPLYQAYKNQYVQGGRLAMQDTMGQAAALTGGVVLLCVHGGESGVPAVPGRAERPAAEPAEQCPGAV